MYKRIYLIAGLIFILNSCTSFDRGPKSFVKSVRLPGHIRIDWYVYGSMSGTGPDYLEISSDSSKPFFSTFFLSDVRVHNDTVLLSLWKGEYNLDKDRLNGLQISIDTLGKAWNQAESRLDRLKRRNVNVEEPHFVDVFCEKGECE